MLFNRIIPVVLLLVAAGLPHSGVAALPDDAILYREKNALHFLLAVKKVTVSKLEQPNGEGNAVCLINGTILELYNAGNTANNSQQALAAPFETGRAILIQVGCSDTDYAVVPGGFGLSKSHLDASRLELWGEVGSSYKNDEAVIFHPFKALVR